MKFQELKKVSKKPYFSKKELSLYRLTTFDSQLSQWKQKGFIQTLKRGLYVFTDEKAKLSTEDVSFLLYQPSYMSLESALSYYGFIPDIVHAITAVTTKTNRAFQNGYGMFLYRHIQPKLFFGYTVGTTPAGKYLLAEPEKALLDYFYLNLGHIDGQEDIDDLRLNMDEIKQTISTQKIRTYVKEFRIAKLERMMNLVLHRC